MNMRECMELWARCVLIGMLTTLVMIMVTGGSTLFIVGEDVKFELRELRQDIRYTLLSKKLIMKDYFDRKNTKCSQSTRLQMGK
jgi:hypothetical protein